MSDTLFDDMSLCYRGIHGNLAVKDGQFKFVCTVDSQQYRDRGNENFPDIDVSGANFMEVATKFRNAVNKIGRPNYNQTA